MEFHARMHTLTMWPISMAISGPVRSEYTIITPNYDQIRSVGVVAPIHATKFLLDLVAMNSLQRAH